MDPTYEQNYHKLEASHWWFRSRREKVMAMIPINPGYSYLDIGCSTGVLMKMLVDAGASLQQVHGVDISDPAVARARARGLVHIHQLDAENIDLPAGSFDFIVSSDCLEHLPHDEQALQNWFRLLKPGGQILIFVPAFGQLWSPHDVINHHYRRYEPGELARKMQAIGYQVQETGYWNSLLFPAIWFYRLLRNTLIKWGVADRAPRSDLQQPHPLVNALLLGLLSFENRLGKWVRFPFGVSTFVKAIKPN